MTKQHMVGALNSALHLEMERDKKVVLLGEDIGVDGGVFRVTEGLYAKYGSERVIDTPLAEAGIVGTSIGLALGGLKPIPEMQFSGFSFQAFHHIEQHMARFRQRSDGMFCVPMVLRAPCSGGIRALEHHSDSPESFFLHCTGIKIVMPSGPYDAKGLLISSIRDNDPVIFLEPKKIYRAFKEDVPDESYTIPLSKANIVKQGSGLTVVTWGAMLRLVMEAIEAAQVDAEVIDLRTLWPYDLDTILTSVKRTGRCLIVHEAPRVVGLGAELAAEIQEHALLKLSAPVFRVTGWDVPFPQYALEDFFLPNVKRIMLGIRHVMEY